MASSRCGARPTLFLLMAAAFATLVASSRQLPTETFNPYATGSHPEEAGGVEPVEPTFSESVMVLTENDFSQRLERVPLALVVFHAPWSGSCQSLYPHLDGIAATLNAAQPRIRVAAVDLSKHSQLGKRFHISGFPTLSVFRAGEEAKVAENQVPRDPQLIAEYMLGLTQPAAEEWLSVAQASRVVDPSSHRPVGEFADKAVIVGFSHAGEHQQSFLDLARFVTPRKMRFFFTENPDVADEYSGTFDSIVMYRPATFGPSPVRWPRRRPLTPGECLDFIANFSTPLVGSFTAATRELYNRKRLPMLVVFHSMLHDRLASHPLGSPLSAVARSRVGNTSVVLARPQENSVLVKYLERGAFYQNHAYAMALLVGKHKFLFEADIAIAAVTEDVIGGWLRGVFAGRVPEFHKSERGLKGSMAAPGGGRVLAVSYETFETTVMNPTQDCFLFVYHPRDQHCARLSPVWQALAESFKGVRGLSIASMNAVENDLPVGYEVLGFPFLLFAPRNNKTHPTRFTGTRTLVELRAFVARAATVPLEADAFESDRSEL